MHTPLRIDGPRRRGLLAGIAGASLALLAGCSASAAPPAPPHTSSPTASASSSSGNISSGNQNGTQGNSTSGSFSLAFAKCMQKHGMPTFPDPNGQANQLGPGSGFDPNTPQFQAAINGPCSSLAPPGWVGSGKVTP